ncbi:MAG: hypothetical protein A2X49_05160 [Lentisphaerae bacterium GWF2_52_8]|nr:MAG: hypothetical protein A2X49_05160 [Lentisphaerae bacterium GWF2_52_8]
MPAKKRSRILVVDDDPMNILILQEILGTKYDMQTASSGEEAIAVSNNFKPDLIMIDNMMQDTNGYDVCRHLRSNPKLKLTKIILVSKKTLLKDRLIGYEAGADDFIAKPFDPEELLAKVGIFIRLKSVEEIDRVKDDLINLFSHETRTPLNAIMGFAKLLQDSPNVSPDEKEFVNIIIESGTSLLALSNKAILLSSLRKENKEISAAKVQLHTLVEDALRHIPEPLKNKRIKLDTHYDMQSVLNVDNQLVGTALGYLVDNAYKFSPDEGKVLISSENSKDRSRFLIHISDSGKGIPPGRLSSIFDEFGIEDVGHHGRGHGLSLAIVKYVMELHSGEVIAGNNPKGEGAIFTLAFPLSSVSAN